MSKTKHLKTKYSIARYSLIRDCTGEELRFYLYVKLYAINKNSAFPSQKAFKIDLNWSKYVVNRIVMSLEKKGRLKVKREKGKNNVYDITWYDNCNEKVSRLETLTTSGRETLATSRRETLTQTTKNKTSKKQQSVSKADEEKKEFNFKDKMKLILEDSRRHIQIIGIYWRFKNYNFSNVSQYGAALKRELRAAQKLSGYSNGRIAEVMDWLEAETDIKWTLETCHKFIDDDLGNIAPMKKRFN